MRPFLALLLMLGCAFLASEARAGCGAAGVADLLQDVAPEGDLTLREGGLARLAGLRFPDEHWREAALAALKGQIGREIRVSGPEERDRWGRRTVRLVTAEHASGAPAGDLSAALVAAGLAMADPGTGEAACGVSLLALEGSARMQGLGLWAGDRYTPIPVAELARLKDRIGRFALVEGRVRSIGERPQRTYLNFSSEWASDFTIIVPKRIWSRLAEKGLTAASFRGRLIRARGILEERQGPALTLSGPDMIEVMDEGRRL